MIGRWFFELFELFEKGFASFGFAGKGSGVWQLEVVLRTTN